MPRASSGAPPVRAETTSVSAEPPCSTARLSPSSTQPSPDFVARVVTRRRSQRASTSVCANAILCLPWISAGKIRARCSALPPRATKRPPSPTVARYGSTTSASPNASKTISMSIVVPPKPP